MFSKPVPAKRVLRKRLGIDIQLPCILLVGGGEGMGLLEDTVRELDMQLGSRAQVVVICGRNKKLLQDLSMGVYPGGLKVHARGFVDNMHEWMCASDVIITKVCAALGWLCTDWRPNTVVSIVQYWWVSSCQCLILHLAHARSD